MKHETWNKKFQLCFMPYFICYMLYVICYMKLIASYSRIFKPGLADYFRIIDIAQIDK
jgi:hypothetical protein